MAGVRQIMKKLQSLQKKNEEIQNQLSEQIIEVSYGGGAIQIQVTGAGDFKKVTLDEEFYKEESKEALEEALLEALVEATEKVNEVREAEMGKISNDLGLGGMMG